jgi:hypothetical protein
MIRRHGAAFALLLMAVVPFPASADPEECQEALHKYNAAVSDISNAMRIYVGCVNNSRAHDDCSTEFSTLQSAQSDFEDAVLAYGLDCQ